MLKLFKPKETKTYTPGDTVDLKAKKRFSLRKKQ